MTRAMNENDKTSDQADYIAFEEFRKGLRLGHFAVIVNPELARPFVAQRVHLVPLTIAIVGIGVATAVAGHPIPGLLLVATGMVLRRLVNRQAPSILLRLASTQSATYHDATSEGVMEVQRR